ncbi:MAG: hypothetical protein ACYC3I_08115 [Gemmataceae bacterium]
MGTDGVRAAIAGCGAALPPGAGKPAGSPQISPYFTYSPPPQKWAE